MPKDGNQVSAGLRQTIGDGALLPVAVLARSGCNPVKEADFQHAC
jgi:hypothetical protein